MPPSQLKGLKAKLREQGILGPQASKKQKKQNAQNGVNKDKRVNRKVALEGIREQFNPFDFRQAGGKAPKFEVTSMEGRKGNSVLRPGLQRSREQEAVGSPNIYLSITKSDNLVIIELSWEGFFAISVLVLTFCLA